MKMKKVIAGLLTGALMATSFFAPFGMKEVNAAVVSTIPNTTKVEKSYNESFLSVPGYASLGVHDRSSYVGTSYYRTVSTARQFLQAIVDAQSGSVKVIELTADIGLGWNELALSTAEASTYSFVTKYGDPLYGFTNPVIETSGVSKVSLSNIDGLTIFSTSGKTIKHAELKLNGSCNDIVIRNLKFDEMWQWDDPGTAKEVGWTFIKVNGANNVWLDHCKFTIAADGMVDIENGSTNVTFSWCDFGLAANEGTSSSHYIYKTIMNMESKYKAGSLDSSSSVYYKMRKAGATTSQIMAYSAYHKKCHLVGSGDKDYTNYVNSSGVEYLDGNQRLKLTMAYNHYTNTGSRQPMVRQGTAHLFNCYFDNSTHESALKASSGVSSYGTSMSRGLNARNGASIAADTCVYNYMNEPVLGSERCSQEASSLNSPFNTLMAAAYNRALVVNSKVTNTSGTSYTGSSWDNNGSNLFTSGFSWYDKSTINNWAWSSSINGVDHMDKSNPPSTAFTYTYHTNEVLPYAYQTVPLSSVVSTLNSYGGAGVISMTAAQWLKTVYGVDAYSTIEAENYSSMSGVSSESCGEGGQDVGFIQNGDYLVFKNVDFGIGAKSFAARVATSNSSAGNIEIRLDSVSGTLAGTCALTSTGAWQTYTTQNCTLNSTVTGTHDVYLKFTGSSSGYLFNINWFRFIGVDAYSTIQAEDYSRMLGVRSETCGEGGQDVGYIEDYDYLAFDSVNFGTGANSFAARVATSTSGGKIQIILDNPNGTVVGTCNVATTGAWQTYTTQSCTLNTTVTGTHTVYLKFIGNSSGYLFNVNWFKFVA